MAGRKILLVEGVDDEHVLKHVCGTRRLQKLDEIKSQEGVDQLLENFPVRLKESDLEAVGVVIDADTDLAARWQALHDRLVQAGYQDVPTDPDPTGTILEPPPNALLPRVGVWIMPDNKTNGILEDFLRFLVPDGSRLFEHAESSVDAIPEGERRFEDAAKPKALIHTWLSWQKEPGKPLGTAITARYLDSGVAQVDTLVNWLNRLFFS
ncbi:MAG: hypothetical protein H3C30_16855 [Candidatus Hydrogenedentes bacterium]|nr:hypothetical protein [Candidatus Hydrogenedentota bacterium]